MPLLLAKKLFRELRAQKGQALAVLAVTSLGVLLFVASAGAYLDLRDSYAHTREQLRLAGLHVDVPSASSEDVAKIRALPGVRRAEARVVAELPVELSGQEAPARLFLRILSLPDSGEPELDRVLLLSGGLPGPGEVLLEKHLAQRHRLSAGDRIAVRAGDVEQELSVSGVGVSAEYLWVARDEHDVFPDPDAFGVGWMRRGALRELARRVAQAAPALPGIEVAAGAGTGNQLLVDPAPGVAASALAPALVEALGADRVLAVTPADRLVGVRLLQMDVDGYQGMAAFFPILFLGVGAFIVASILARLIDAQRQVVGTLMALGLGRARILGHYLSYALVLGGVGALAGAALGLAAAPAMTREYAGELGIPFVVASLHWDLLGWGVLAGVATALLAGAFPALHASRLPPAEAMRPPRPSAVLLARLTRRLRAPLSLRLAVRSLLGRPFRSFGTALGVAAALVVVLTTGGMLDSMSTVFDALFRDARRYELRVDLVGPEALAPARGRFAALPGVEAVEGLLALPVSIRADGRPENALAQGLPEGGTLLRSLDVDGREVPPASGGVVLTRALAKKLGAKPGDEVRLRLGSFGEAPFQVSGLADAALGDTASARLDDLQRAFHLEGQVTAVTLKVQGARLAEVKRQLARLDDVAHVEDASSLRHQLDALMGLGWALMLAMLACSVVLASAILFNTATLSILERRRDLATLRALGRTMREITVGLTVEHLLLALVGLCIGLPLAMLATREVLALYSSDLFVLPFVLTVSTVAWAFLGIVGVLLVAQWPALRRLSRASVAEAVRDRL